MSPRYRSVKNQPQPCHGMHIRLITISIMLIVLALSVQPLSAGTLGDFERDATKTNADDNDRKERKKEDSPSSGDTCLDEAARELCTDACIPFLGAAIHGIAKGGALSMDRVNPDSLAAQHNEQMLRKEGEALIPFVRMDTLYQESNEDIAAWDSFLIAGYGAAGLQVRRTVYKETEPADKLRILEYHALYRMSFGRQTEVDFGAGSMVLDGAQKHRGFSLTIPVRVHPSEHYGFEFRPVWSFINENTIQDYDVAALLGWRFVSLTAGYRWLRSPHESLRGPELGVSIRW